MQHGVGDQVILLGHLDHPTLTRARVGSTGNSTFSPSLWVGDREAQASGLPVVSYEAGSVPEVVKKNVTGW